MAPGFTHLLYPPDRPMSQKYLLAFLAGVLLSLPSIAQTGSGVGQPHLREDLTCLEMKDGGAILPASGQTPPHLTVTWFQFVDDLTFKFTGIPIHSNIEPNSEGCEATDSSVLVYKTQDDTPLFYRTGNIRGEVVSHEELLMSARPAYNKLGQLTKASNLVLRYDYLGNCGGCFSAVIFSRTPVFQVVAEYYFDPAKYGEIEGPTLKKYDSKGGLVASYKIE